MFSITKSSISYPPKIPDTKKEKLPDLYWWFFSSNVDDWHKLNKQRDRDRWNRIYRDKKERSKLRSGLKKELLIN